MSNEWIDGILGGSKISKEAMDAVGKDAKDTFERKVIAHDWVNSVLELDADKVEAEYQAKLAEEAKLLGKTAAYEQGETPKETVKRDWERDVKILSDYALAEMLAEARGHEAQNTNEMYYELKEKAKAEVASSREKAEKALLDTIPENAQLDWEKAFAKYTKEAKPEEPKEKDLFKSEVPEKAHDFQNPKEDKFKVPAEDKKADVMIGVGREADERQDVTREAGVLKVDITEGLAKEASIEKKADEAIQPIKRDELYDQASCEGCPVCGGAGKDLKNGQTDHLSCMACGISYAPKEIQSCASREEVIKKVAELSKKADVPSCWVVEKQADGKEYIVRKEIKSEEKKDLNKESEEKKDEEIQK